MRVSAAEMADLLASRKWPDFTWTNGPWYRAKQYGSGRTNSEPVGRRRTRWLPCLMRALAADERKRLATRKTRRKG